MESDDEDILKQYRQFGKKFEESSRPKSDCPEGKIRNPKTGKCVKIDGRIGKEILKSRGKSSPKRDSPKRGSPKRDSPKNDCPEGKIRNPATKRCVSVDGIIGRKILGRSPQKSKGSGGTKYKKDKDENIPDWEPPIIPSPIFKSPQTTCISRSKLPLKSYQKRVVKYFENQDALLVVHGTGAGKTLSAVTVSQCYLDKYKDGNVVFIGPTSLLKNFEKEMKNYGVKNSKKYKLFSYQEVRNKYKSDDKIKCTENTLLIVDEAHNLRTYDSLTYNSVFDCAKKAKKRLLLTATPFVNNSRDFISLINILYGDKILGTPKEVKEGLAYSSIPRESKEDFYLGVMNEKTKTLLYKLLKGKVDFYKPSKLDGFPDKNEYYIPVVMSPEYEEKYLNLIKGERVGDIEFNKPSAFYNGHRRAVNYSGPEYFSTKLNKIRDILKKGKSIIYTNWIEFGLNPVVKFLKENNIKYTLFNGDMTKDEKAESIRKYNNNKVQVMIITKAGSEGLDLKETRSVIILDPVWNDAGLEQIMGRAIRYNSHVNLPKDEQVVNIYKLILVTSVGKDNWEDDYKISGDATLYSIIKAKEKFSKEFNKLLLSLSLKKDSPVT